MVFLTACTTNTFTYSGESENWSANLKVIHTSDDLETEEFKLEYKGTDIDSVGEITYRVVTSGSFERSGAALEKNGTLTYSNEANQTHSKVTEHTEAEVTVEWNDNKETFSLDRQ